MTFTPGGLLAGGCRTTLAAGILWTMEPQHSDRRQGYRRFRIWVHGRLDEDFHLGLTGIEQETIPAGTVLSGGLLDQSQLHSTLDLLRGLGIEVLRFEVDPPAHRGHDKENS